MAFYGNGLLKIDSDRLVIDTGFTEREATHSKIFQSFNEAGLIITKNEDNSFTFDNYFFQDNFSDYAEGRKTESIFVNGPGFFGVPLYNLFSEDVSKAAKAVNFLNQAVEYSFLNNISIPNIGPLGIIVGGEKSNENQLLILPPAIFTKTLTSRTDAFYSQYCGIYKRDALKNVDSWRFTLSCYAYRILTGKNPFSNLDSLDRVWDYVDFNFVPPEYFVKLKDFSGNEIDTKAIFEIINNNLSVLPLESVKKSKRYKYVKPQTIPIPFLQEDFSIESLNPLENSEYQKKEKKLKKIRFLRKYNLHIKIIGISLIVLSIILFSMIKDISARPTTKGLTPDEVVKMFYDGVDSLNVDMLDGAISKGSIAKTYKNFVSNMYVTSHMRESYESEKHSYSLEEWVNLLEPSKNYFYGITDFSMSLVEDGDITKKYVVDYYISYNDPENAVVVNDCSDILEVSFAKGKWTISFLDMNLVSLDFDPYEFYEDIKIVVDSIPYENKENQGALLVEELQEKYQWLPSVEEAKNGYQQLLSYYY